jgi:hypothetical protein
MLCNYLHDDYTTFTINIAKVGNDFVSDLIGSLASDINLVRGFYRDVSRQHTFCHCDVDALLELFPIL